VAQTIETAIVGGGQAGLAVSYYLRQHGHEHVILEQAAQAGHAWRNDRWDSFTLLTPNWSFRLPGAEYAGEVPDGFMPRVEVVARFEDYGARFNLPVEYGQRVLSVDADPSGRGYRVTTAETVFQARHVVIATGLYQRPKRPAFSAALPPGIMQLASGQYRHPGALPPGAVLVVGSGQSGCQIAEELYLSGRVVYLCVGRAGRAPRRYRGRDIYDWLNRCGFLDRTPDKLPSPQAKFAANPQVSGRDGGRSLNLHQFAHDGVRLLGHLQDARDGRLWLAPDLYEKLAATDKAEADLIKLVDNYIAQAGLDAPPETLPQLRDGFAVPEVSELDLRAAGITSVIWALGYSFDFSLVRLPVFDGDGYPVQRRGVTESPGLYFVGLPWLYKQKSGLLVGFGEDADYIAGQIAAG